MTDHVSVTLQRCLSTVLRVLVSLTHEDELWGRKVVQCEYTMSWLLRLIHRTGQEVLHNGIQVKTEEEEAKVEETEEALSSDQDGAAHAQADSHELDILCLALGLLTNLIQIVDEAKVLVRDIRKCYFLSSITLLFKITRIRSESFLYSQETDVRR